MIDELIELHNKVRAEYNLPQFIPDKQLGDWAQKHAERMGTDGVLVHSKFMPFAQNIGVGQSLEQIFNMWMEDRPHKANIVNPYNQRIGIGVFSTNAYLWVCVNFEMGERYGDV